MGSTRSSVIVHSPGALPKGLSRAGAGRQLRLPLVEAWHLLSLDAPLVTTVWLLFAARMFAVALPPRLGFAMFLLVWLLYAVDRLLDARTALAAGRTQTEPLAARHIFHHRHRRWFGAVAVVVAIALVPLIASLPTVLFEGYGLLGTMLAGWLMLVHFAPRLRARVLPKEPVVGLFFAPAVMMPELLAAGVNHGEAAAATVLLGALCAANCWAISRWEQARRQRKATQFWIPAGVAAGSMAMAFAAYVTGGPWQLFAASGLAAVALIVLDRMRQHVTATTLRAGADLVLLTPLLFGLLR